MLNPRPVELDSPLNRRVRVFLGIGPAAPEWAEPLSLWVTQLSRRVENWKWTGPANFHLTLRFFGSVTQADVLKITDLLPEITRHCAPFILEAVDLALFPSEKHPRVAAIALGEKGSELSKLEQRIRDFTATIGQAPEQRDFIPHVTFGRIRENDRRSQSLVGELWRQRAMPRLPDWPVNEVVLFKSDLQAGGSIYTPISKFPLGA